MSQLSVAERVQDWAAEQGGQWYRLLKLMYLRMGKNVANLMAAAIAFYALVCVGPLGILMAWAMQPLLGENTNAYEQLRETITQIGGAAAGTIMVEIDALVTNPNPHTAGIVSIALLFWAGLRLFETLERSMTELWPGQVSRHFVTRKLLALAITVVAGLLLIAVIVISALLPFAMDWVDRWVAVDLSSVFWLQPGMRIAIQLAFAVLAFFLLFKFIPGDSVRSRSAFAGAIFTTVAWAVVSPIFSWFTMRSAEGGAIYGGLAGVVMFLTWAFFSARILLLGTEFAAAYDHVMVNDAPESADDAYIRATGDEGSSVAQAPDERDEPAAGARPRAPRPVHNGPPLV